jgi:Holliday junction DNA helicase RuvA
MYESIRGTLKDKTTTHAIVECSGLAYRLCIPLSTYLKLPHQEAQVHLFLSQVIREDAHILYAFLLKEERDLFEQLLSVSGIGPKTASGIIGHMEPTAFQRAISASDTRLLSKLPGIGKKTAERLVIEMRDKFKAKGFTLSTTAHLSETQGIVGDAINALIHLGYHALDANKAVQSALKANEDEKDLGRLITAALQGL